MVFEHFALNVPDARAMAAWYAAHCGAKAVRSMDRPPFTHFLADRTGRTFVELYTNTGQPFDDFRGRHPLLFHFAFAVADAEAAKEALLAAGATFVEEVRPDAGSLLVTLRDPWGVPLQVCQRSEPMAALSPSDP